MPRPALLLKGAAVLTFVLGIGLVVWLVDKAIRYPQIHAEQFGQSAPLWLPLIGFVILFLGGVVWLFWKAARRFQTGESQPKPSLRSGKKSSGCGQ